MLYVRLFEILRAKGYQLHLFFLWIPDAELAIARIKDRVAEGGHNVPSQDVRRRFRRSISNFFKLYQPLLDSWMLFDNSRTNPLLIAKRKDAKLTVIDEKLFSKIFQWQNKL